jgi:hypothetical protein
MAANGRHPLPRHKQTTATPIASGPGTPPGNRIRMGDRQVVRRNDACSEDDSDLHRVRTVSQARQPEMEEDRHGVRPEDWESAGCVLELPPPVTKGTHDGTRRPIRSLSLVN